MAKLGERGPKLGNLIKFEDWTDYGYCRKTVTVNEAAETEYKIGNLLGTDGTAYKISDPAAVDGSEVIDVVVIENKTIPAATNTEVAVLFRGPAGVADGALILGDHTEADAASALEGKGIKVMEQV